ncbi:MAG: hypothetical protein RR115_02190 [Hydrogenoanaerobacterium sp.]
MKRFISLFLVFAMLFIMAVPAFAVDEPPYKLPSDSIRLSSNSPIFYTSNGVKNSIKCIVFEVSEIASRYLKVDLFHNDNFLDNFSISYGGEQKDFKFDIFYSKSTSSFIYCDSYSYVIKYSDGTTGFLPRNNYPPNKPQSVVSFSIPSDSVFDELPPAETVPDFGEDKTNGFVGDYGCKILLPRNGFKQSKLNAIVLKTYYKIPFDGDINKVKIKVTGYTGDKQVVNYHKINKLNNNTVLEGYLDFSGAVSWNVLCPITLTITDYTGKEYTSSVKVLCYDDFIDKNNDGKDDRTNDDEWTGNPDFNKPIIPDNSLPAGAGVTDWFKWFFGNVGSFFETIKSGFSSMVSLGGDFVSFLGVGFSYIPKEIFTILGFGFAIMIFLRIFGR